MRQMRQSDPGQFIVSIESVRNVIKCNFPTFAKGVLSYGSDANWDFQNDHPAASIKTLLPNAGNPGWDLDGSESTATKVNTVTQFRYIFREYWVLQLKASPKGSFPHACQTRATMNHSKAGALVVGECPKICDRSGYLHKLQAPTAGEGKGLYVGDTLRNLKDLEPQTILEGTGLNMFQE